MANLKLLKFPEVNLVQRAVEYLIDRMNENAADEYLIQATLLRIVHNKYFHSPQCHLSDAICVKLIEIQALIDEYHQREIDSK